MLLSNMNLIEFFKELHVCPKNDAMIDIQFIHTRKLEILQVYVVQAYGQLLVLRCVDDLVLARTWRHEVSRLILHTQHTRFTAHYNAESANVGFIRTKIQKCRELLLKRDRAADIASSVFEN